MDEADPGRGGPGGELGLRRARRAPMARRGGEEKDGELGTGWIRARWWISGQIAPDPAGAATSGGGRWRRAVCARARGREPGGDGMGPAGLLRAWRAGGGTMWRDVVGCGRGSGCVRRHLEVSGAERGAGLGFGLRKWTGDAFL